MNTNGILWMLSSLIVASKQNTIPATTTTTTTAAAGASHEQTSFLSDWQPIGLYNIMKHCVQQPDMFTCLKKLIVLQLNEAIQNSDTWQVNRFVTFKKDPNWVDDDDNATHLSESRSFTGVSIMDKLKELVSSRLVQISLGGSDTLVEEGRKKGGGGGKDKHGMMMLGGMAFMAMMAQMVLGKIAFMAAAAFLLAKLALLFSALGGLKKVGGGGGGAEVVVDHGHSGGYTPSGWQRSIDQRDQHHDPYKGHAYGSAERI